MDIDEVSCAWHACGAQVTLTRCVCVVRVCLCSVVDGQYGGSGAMHKVEEAEGSVAGQRELILTGGAKNALVAVQRYVANNVTDYERQQVMTIMTRGLWLCDCVTRGSLLVGGCPCPTPHNKLTSHELPRCMCVCLFTGHGPVPGRVRTDQGQQARGRVGAAAPSSSATSSAPHTDGGGQATRPAHAVSLGEQAEHSRR